MSNTWGIVLTLLVFTLLIGLLVFLNKKIKLNFGLRVFAALVLGAVFGISLQVFFNEGSTSKVVIEVTDWINVIGTGFIRTLQLLIVPLVLVSIVRAIMQLTNSKKGVKKAVTMIGILLISTAISAIITIFFVRLFNLSADHLIDFQEMDREPVSIQTAILNMIPNNLFSALSSNSLLSIVFIAVLVGFAYLTISKENPKIAESFEKSINVAHSFVMQIVDFVIEFTPYGVLSIVAVRTALGSGELIVSLGLIVAVSFIILLAIFIMHLMITWIGGVNPLRYLKKTAPALIFAFSSRSSAAALPLTINVQRKLGVSEEDANLSSAFGTCIGQNACAGFYPTMLAILVASVQGLDVWAPNFLIPLVIYVVISSIGTAGVGGGATQISLMVLSLMGLPIELTAILISVDFIIDMGRTLVNVNNSILTGYITGKLENNIDKDILFDKISFDLKQTNEIQTNQ